MIDKTQHTEKLKSYIKKIVDSKGLTVTNSSRHCYHIRFKLDGNVSDFINFFNEFDIKVSISDYSCSSKSPTYILENVKALKNIPIYTKLYWVNNEVSSSQSGSKIFATKDLSPDKLNLTDQNYYSFYSENGPFNKYEENSILIEPLAFFRLGGEKVKFSFKARVNWIIKISNPDNYIPTMFLNVGLGINFSPQIKLADNKNKDS